MVNVEGSPIRIGTRGSALALWQARAVRDALAAANALPLDAMEIVPIRTSGDRVQDRRLAEAGGKGLFTKEIEERLLDGSVDIAVHSAKDMETFLHDRLVIGACLEREDARDALIARDGLHFSDLPQGARIGTASLRREALLRRLRPDLRVSLLRGNVQTRIDSVAAGRFDATLLATAGLKRLGLEAAATEILPLNSFPPACGQGVVAIERRADDERVKALLDSIDHAEASAALTCERAFLAALNGSCRTPIAGYARLVDGGALHFDGMVLSPDGMEFYGAEGEGAPADAADIGRIAGEAVLSRARPGFLEAVGIA